MFYEIKKLTCNKVIVWGFIICFLCGMVYSYYNFMWGNIDYSEIDMAEEEQYHECMGRYTDEKYIFLKNILDEKIAYYEEHDNDSSAFLVFQKYSELYSKAEVYYDTIKYRENVVKRASQLKQSEGGYYAGLNERLEKLYSQNIEFHINEGNVQENIAEILMVSAPVDVAYILLLIIISCNMFIEEHRSGTYLLVYSSYKGRRYTYHRKIFLMLVMACLLSISQTISMLSFSIARGGISELCEPVQEIKLLMHSPYSVNILQMLIIITVFRGIADMALAGIFIFISLFFKSSLVPLAINSFIGLGGFGITYFYSGQFVTPSGSMIQQADFYRYMREYSPYVLIKYGLKYLEKYEAVNIFEYPVTLISIVVTVNIVIAAVFLFAGYVVYKHRFRIRGV